MFVGLDVGCLVFIFIYKYIPRFKTWYPGILYWIYMNIAKQSKAKQSKAKQIMVYHGDSIVEGWVGRWMGG